MPLPPRRSRPRLFALEPLELRAVPAGLVQEVMLPPDVVSGPYSSAVVARSEILVSGKVQNKPVILEMNDEGEITGSIALGLPEGRNAGSVVAISDNGQWALGICPMAGSSDIPDLAMIWNLQDPARPRVVEPLRGVHDLIPSFLTEHASITDDGSFVFNSLTLGINLVHSDGSVEKVPQPFDSNPISPSDQSVRAISEDGRTMVGIDVPGKVLIWHDLTPSDLPVPPTAYGGDAETISADGRVVGGTVADLGRGGIGIYPQATVWVDGNPRILRDAGGNQLDGTLDYILPQSGGEDHGWIVIGRTYGLAGFEGRYIAFADSTFSDYTLTPLHEFIQQQSGTDSPVSLPTVINVELRDNSLYVFTAVIEPVAVPIGRIGDCTEDPPLLYPDRLGPDAIPRCMPVLSANHPSQVNAPFQSLLYVVPLPSPLDVNADGEIAPSDVLLVINTLNDQLARGSFDGSLPAGSHFIRLDVNRDSRLSAADALMIINRLNADAAPSAATSPTPSSPSAEGEASTTAANDSFALAADELFADLAAKRRK